MGIKTSTTKLHWNYFIALEQDMEAVTRFIEFDEKNFGVYSIELAHLLFAAASEVDVVAKLVCGYLDPTVKVEKINQYKAVLMPGIPTLPTTKVYVPRYGLTLEPWSNWGGKTNPDWWTSYNKVKHERSAHFNQATLKNALNALAGLMVLTHEYYARQLSQVPMQTLYVKDVTGELQPESTLLRFGEDWYNSYELRE